MLPPAPTHTPQPNHQIHGLLEQDKNRPTAPLVHFVMTAAGWRAGPKNESPGEVVVRCTYSIGRAVAV